MARHKEGWKLTLDKRSGIYGVRWRSATGARRHVTTGERDPDRAAVEAAAIYAEAVSGRRRAGTGGSRVEIDVIAAEWLAAAEHQLDEQTHRKYKQYVGAWSSYFGTLDRMTAPAIEDFWRARLREAKRRTVIKQLYALNVFLRWLRARDIIGEVPAYEMPPRSATGTPTEGRRQVETVPLSACEVERLLAALPEWSRRAQEETGRKWRVQDRFIVAWETALRPATLDAIQAPGDYQEGAARLKIRDEIDKARFGREVPLSGRAREALDRCVPEIGPVLGRVDSHTASAYLRAAAKVAKLPEEKATRIKPYDLRHARLTLLAETGNLVGVAFLAGHKAITTTNRYVHAHARAAEDVLAMAAGTGFGTGGSKKKGLKRGR